MKETLMNILGIVKEKTSTTKILAILGVVLILAGLFFNVGTLKFKVKSKEMKKELKDKMGSYVSDEDINKRIDELEKETKRHSYKGTEMQSWGGIVILISGVAALALVYIDFVKAKLPEETVKKITIWDKLENRKMVWAPAVITLVVLILTWQIPLKKDFADDTHVDYKEVKKELEEAEKEAYMKASFVIGSGFVFIFLGAAALVAYPILYKPEIADATPATTEKEEVKE